MFWGVILESGKRYTQQVEAPFHLTMAALDVVNSDSKKSSKPVSVMVEHDKVEYLLCTLTHEKTFQKNLDLVFGEGEELAFFLNGEGTVHLTGYILPDEFDEEDFENMSDAESDLSDAIPDAVPVAGGDGKKRKQAANVNAEPNKKPKQEVKVAASPQKAEAEAKAEDKKATNGVAKKGQQQQQQQAKKDTPAKGKPVKPAAEEDSDDDDDDDDDSSMDDDVKAKYEKLMKLGVKPDVSMGSEDDDDDDDDDDDEDDDDDDLDDDDSDEDEESMNEKLQASQKKMKQSLGGDQKTPKGILKTPGSAKKPNQNQNQQQQQNQQKTPNQNQNQNQNQGKKPFTPKGQNQGGNQFQKRTPPNQFSGKKQFGGKGNTPNSAPFNKESKPESAAVVQDKKSVVTLGNGLKIQEVRVGNGPEAKPGKFVHVKYVGRLANNQVFDKSGNSAFAFRLGAGEVIKGWDSGIKGMKVGGKRILTIPAQLAYGKRGQGPIPANATLNFEVELAAVN